MCVCMYTCEWVYMCMGVYVCLWGMVYVVWVSVNACVSRLCATSVSVYVCAHTSMHTALLRDPRESMVMLWHQLVNKLVGPQMWAQRRFPAPCSGERVRNGSGGGGQGKSAGAEPGWAGGLFPSLGSSPVILPLLGGVRGRRNYRCRGRGNYRWASPQTITSLRHPASL